MIVLDTDILARFYVDDPGDPESAKQRPIAYEIFTTNPNLFVPLTVFLELEWVLRAFYRFDAAQVIQVMKHLLGLPNVNVEEVDRIAAALELLEQGLDFADALHLAGNRHCEALYTFDDRRFARRARRLELRTRIVVPGSESSSMAP
ncbi:type II toxin-antitoxin system VapC family toxin [Thiocapsa sp.]|uniref:type II toxin-antitoxin system VapC family toxin n=1 Tax=Thiocapsa sp. TaxID=2024551 RepID=UPI0025ED9EC6|nr:type II toxin-antitoxin system VapC family toxin [Thiocapsa sp.]